MAQEELKYTVPANSSTNAPAINVDAILTISDTANPDGSYTVTAISGTRGSDAITGVAPVGTDSNDNEIFLSGNIVDGSGVSYVTTGSPSAAGAASSADVNFYHPTNTDGYLEDTTPFATFLTNVSITAPCYAHGTRLLTTRGEVAVETLSLEDVVITAAGLKRQIKWIGQRHTDCSRHPAPHDVWPVRVSSDAFGVQSPRCDLLLSPDHSVFIDGVLIPIRYLINDATIVQEQTTDITYWHVELDVHDILLAEGVPCESYLDTGNRADFENGGSVARMHPEFALRAWETQACAPLVRSGPRLAAARQALLHRAQELGHILTDDPDLHLEVSGQKLRSTRFGGLHQFSLPEGACDIRLVSRRSVPARVRDESSDHRKLGVAISRIWIDGREASLNSPALRSGWHDAEEKWRWTDGDAILALNGARSLFVELAITELYWINDDQEHSHRRAISAA